jgi:hypothetical protein
MRAGFVSRPAVSTAITLPALADMVRSSAQLARRKLTFFISDKLFLDTRKQNLLNEQIVRSIKIKWAALL